MLGAKVAAADRDAARDRIEARLSSQEAEARLWRYGPNAVREERSCPVLVFLRKLWAPVPWLLELSLALELVLGHRTQATIIAALLMLNAGLSFVQEGRARRTLALLRRCLTIQARVLRDGRWCRVSARELVPGDVVRVLVGDIGPADLRFVDGRIEIDQSTPTGEPVPVERGLGDPAYAGSVIRRGKATGDVTVTSRRTYYGKAAELSRVPLRSVLEDRPIPRPDAATHLPVRLEHFRRRPSAHARLGAS
jgi:H+-transporting ATPase